MVKYSDTIVIPPTSLFIYSEIVRHKTSTSTSRPLFLSLKMYEKNIAYKAHYLTFDEGVITKVQFRDFALRIKIKDLSVADFVRAIKLRVEAPCTTT